MVYSEQIGAPSIIPTISTTERDAKTFVENLIKRAVDNVLYREGRRAGLSDDVVSLILQQLEVDFNYNPLKCAQVSKDPAMIANAVAMMINCQIISGIVTNVCMPMAVGNCNAPAHFTSVPSQYLSISGSLKTNNIIMANWQRPMWQSVLNRVLRDLSSGSLASNFNAAYVVFD